MRNPLSKTPFLFLLIPLIAGILLEYYLNLNSWSIAFLVAGGSCMLLSFFIPGTKYIVSNAVFGIGVIVSVIGISAISTDSKMQQSEFAFSPNAHIYKGVILDIPQEKPNSIAYKVQLKDNGKSIVCYFSKDAARLIPGDVFFFKSVIQPFRNAGNPDDFDYVQYMFNQGFSGSAYIASNNMKVIGETDSSLKVIALRCRMHILDFYHSLGVSENEYSILSALTLGYQDALSDDIKQAFRTTGTVHVLSVSGLHVGIIYVMISFFLSFFKRFPKLYWLKPSLIILLLWVYAFITGLPPSVIRASAMLTVFCVSQILKRRSFSINGLYIAAFFMLLINPLSLFDIGFQLSFLSVLSILYLHPRLTAYWKVKNKYIRYLWQMLALSLVAQLATFPLCLYYFGTFPTYFFIANLVIVPLVTFITYTFGGIIAAKLLSLLLPSLSYFFYYLPILLLQSLVKLMTSFLEFFQYLPFSLVKDVNFSATDLFFLSVFILGIIFFLMFRKAKPLIVGLASLAMIFTIHTYDNIAARNNHLVVYNRHNATQIKWNIGHIDYMLRGDDINEYQQINLDSLKLLIITKNIFNPKVYNEKYRVDYLLLTKDNSLSLYSLTQMICPRRVILDASLSARTRRRLQKECVKINIPCYDVVQNGALSINF